MMYGMRMEDFLSNFAKSSVNLEDLLNITDEKLTELGVSLPIERKRIQLGVLRFVVSVAKFQAHPTTHCYSVLLGFMYEHLQKKVLQK
jgi:hypothetical protein